MRHIQRLIDLMFSVFIGNPLLDVAVGHHDTDHIEVTILILKKGSQILSLVIWAKDENDPLHGSSNPVSVNTLDVVLLDSRHPVDGLSNGCECLSLHLSSLNLSILTRDPVELIFIECLQIIGDIIKVLYFDGGVHFFGFDDHDVLEVVSTWLVRCIVMMDVVHSWSESILQDFESEVIFRVQLTEQHFGEVHSRLEDLGVWEGAHIQDHLHILLLDKIPGHK